jgi:hypothetical protein
MPTFSTFRAWMSALVFIGVLLLVGLPAHANDFFLETGSNWIKGRAQEARLADVLGNLAERSGYSIYIDKKLADVPVTFEIPVALEAEKAIRRIVHPYSYALVFTRVPGSGIIRVQQIKVFSEGSQSAQYILLAGKGTAPVTAASYARGNYSDSRRITKGHVQAGAAAAQRQIRPAIEITKSSLGFTGYRFRDSKRGPDYRPTARTMAKAYAQYRQEREALQDRSDSAVLLNSHKKAEQKKSAYRSQRTETIQQTLYGSQE